MSWTGVSKGGSCSLTADMIIVEEVLDHHADHPIRD